MDDIDRAGELIDMMNEKLVQQARNRPPEASATGECLFCGEDVKPDVRWCSPECRDDWEARH
ncbi:MAG: DUF2116 family Zn-ribbon domain-containing protein [Gammaproteobacteria bacterium]|nr:MAG: DUF2116 family Zn-ribbon domain-containing protein [Gammaproteobacteria bacterium]